MKRYLATLAYHDFRLLWTGMTLSALGDSMSLVALLWLVYQTTGSARQLGWFVAAYTAPVAVGGLVAGSMLDRFDRRVVLLADNLVRGAAFATVPLLYHAGALALWHLYLVAGLFALCKMLPLAGVPAMIPELVPTRELDSANALESIGYGVATLAGPAAAGVLLTRVSGANVVAVDAATYFTFAVLLWRMRPPTRSARSEPEPARVGAGVRPALRFVIGQPAIMATTVMFMLFNVGLGIVLVLLPVYARTVLTGGAGATGFGVLSSALAGGELAGAAAAGMVASRWPLGRAIAGSQLAAGVFLLGLVALPSSQARSHSWDRRRLQRTAHGLGADAANATDPRSPARPRLRVAADRHAGNASARRHRRIRAARRPRPAPSRARHGPADRRARRHRPASALAQHSRKRPGKGRAPLIATRAGFRDQCPGSRRRRRSERLSEPSPGSPWRPGGPASSATSGRGRIALPDLGTSTDGSAGMS